MPESIPNIISLPSLRECAPPSALKMPVYLERYQRHFEPIRRQVRAIFELGVHEGGSLLMWRDYFPNAIVAGLDFNPVNLTDSSGRIRIYQGSQDDLELLDRIAAECAPDGFDIVIDDCAHVGELAKKTFWRLFDQCMKISGIYVLEAPAASTRPFRRTEFRQKNGAGYAGVVEIFAP